MSHPIFSLSAEPSRGKHAHATPRIPRPVHSDFINLAPDCLRGVRWSLRASMDVKFCEFQKV